MGFCIGLINPKLWRTDIFSSQYTSCTVDSCINCEGTFYSDHSCPIHVLPTVILSPKNLKSSANCGVIVILLILHDITR